MQLTIEYEQEEDGRWLAEVLELPGTVAYGESPEEAVSKAKALALRVIAEQIEHGERDTRDRHLSARICSPN